MAARHYSITAAQRQRMGYLRRQRVSIKAIAQRFGVTVPTVWQHLKQLRRESAQEK